MRPIDIIRQGIDNDLIKYKNYTLCEILEAKKMKDVGLVIKVKPLGSEHVSIDNTENSSSIPTGGSAALCVNSPWFIKNIKHKYNALVFNITPDAPNFNGVALLIPKSYIDPFNDDVSNLDEYEETHKDYISGEKSG